MKYWNLKFLSKTLFSFGKLSQLFDKVSTKNQGGTKNPNTNQTGENQDDNQSVQNGQNSSNNNNTTTITQQ